MDSATRLDGPPGTAHFLGICGIGMAGLARLLSAAGWRVSGCDAAPDPDVCRWLTARGIAVWTGHDPAHLRDGCDLLVCSTAVPRSLPEPAAALAKGIPVRARGHVLADWLNARRGIAVCGTHGKTSSTVALTRLLRRLGIDAGWCAGGWGEGLDGPAGAGGDDWWVVEADESDGTLAAYRPMVTLLTNVEFDHAEHFADAVALEACFGAVVAGTRERLVYCADDPGAARLGVGHPGALSYGVDAPGAALQARAVREHRNGFCFELWLHGRRVGMGRLGVTGRHNLCNALGILGVAISLGVAPASALRALPLAYRLPRRRFERYASANGIRVYTDYAHHPREIAAVMQMACARARRVRILFQPHRYSRTRALGAAFPAAFNGAHEVTLCPVYAASEPSVEGGTAADLYARFRTDTLAAGCTVRLAGSLEAAWSGMRRRLRRGDLLAVVGAGDVVRVAEWATAAVTSGRVGVRTPMGGAQGETWRESVRLLRQAGFRGRLASGRGLGRVTGFGCGGGSDGVAEPLDRDDLGLLFRCAQSHHWPLRVLGQGRNVCIDDDGVAGLVVRLRAPCWRAFQVSGDRVWAGAGLTGAALLARLRQHGLHGLSFLKGVPGTVGGWLAMNAGAQGGAVGDCVEAIQRLTETGAIDKLRGDACGWGYRRCEALRQGIALGAWFRLQAGTPAAEARAQQAALARRFVPSGPRTCGSVFRNPVGDHAGRLLDQCGVRGLRIGGAWVDARHANWILTDASATASDVRALMLRMRSAVDIRFGLTLETELDYWEG